MIGNKLGALVLPARLRRLSGDAYVIYSRSMAPLGINSRAVVFPETLPVSVRLPELTPEVAAQLSCRGEANADTIDLFDGSCNPLTSPKCMPAYLDRLARLALLRVAA